jgi:hypothetical protein
LRATSGFDRHTGRSTAATSSAVISWTWRSSSGPE